MDDSGSSARSSETQSIWGRLGLWLAPGLIPLVILLILLLLKKKSNKDKIPFLSFCNPLFVQIKHIFLGFCWFVSMLGTRPRAPCMLGKRSIKRAAFSPQPMCICFEGWRVNIQCLLRWETKAGIVSDFFALGNYDFRMWDIHKFYRRYFCPVLDQPYKQMWIGSSLLPHLKGSHSTLYSGHTLCSGLPTPGSSAQAPEAAGWRSHPTGTVSVRDKAPGLWYLKCRWAIYTRSMLPLYGHHWRKNTGNRWKKKNPWLEWMAFFCENGFKTQVLNPATTSSKRPHSRTNSIL